MQEQVAETWASVGARPGFHPHVPPDIDEFLAGHQAAQQLLATNHLEPWITLSGQGLLWLGHLHLCLQDVIEKSAQHRAGWALTGLATANVVGVRNLCIVGLDTPARTLLRGTAEALALCAACLDDPTLAAEYVGAQSDQASRRLWSQELRSQNLRRRLKLAFRATEPAAEEAVEQFLSWLDHERADHSQATHGSYLAAALTSMSPSLEAPTEFRPGAFGHATIGSVRTLQSLSTTIWLASKVIAHQTLGLGGRATRLRGFNPQHPLEGIVVNGYYAFCHLMNQHWDDGRQSP